MERKKFGKLIIALRRGHLDRQSKPWSRQKFAEESGIDENILTNIENGRRAILYPDLLLKLANALSLTSGERREFLLASSGVDEQNLYPQRVNPKSMLEDILSIMDQMQQPALIVDPFFDVVAVNRMALETYRIDLKDFLNPNVNPATRCSLIRFLFSAEFNKQRAMLGSVWDKFAANTILLFRAVSLRYRASEYFQTLYPQLLYEFDDFKTRILRPIKSKDDHYMDSNIYIEMNHPRHGKINAVSSSITALTTAGELKLFTFTPLSKETANVFINIAQQGNYIFQPLPNWPEKNALAEKHF